MVKRPGLTARHLPLAVRQVLGGPRGARGQWHRNRPTTIAMGVTKPYEFIGFGAMEVTAPYEFIGFGAMEVTAPYEFIGFGAMDLGF